MRRGRSHVRGALLLEALVALAILGIGIAGVAGFISFIKQSNGRQAFQARANESFAALAAQIRAASCDARPPAFDVTGTIDPGLVEGTYTAPVARSTISLVGDVTSVSPPIRIRYTSRRAPDPVAGYEGPPAYDLEVEIREITRDPAKDDPAVTDGFWIRRLPVKKVCNVRMEESGRGEFY